MSTALSEPALIGDNTAWGGRDLDGLLDDIVYYDRRLSDSEISGIVNDSNYPTNGLKVLYTFEDSSSVPNITSITTTGQHTFSSGTIANQIDTPKLTVKSSTLFDGTDAHSVAGWTSATQTRDSSFDGTNNGATTVQTGKIGNAWDFDGSNDYVDLGASSKWIGKEDLSFSLWLNLDSATNNWTVPFQIGDAENPRIALTMDYYNSGGSMYYKMSEGSGNNYAQGSASVPSKGSWVHIVGVMDGSASDIQLYVDGSTVSTTVSGSPTGTPSNLSGDAYLGNSMYSSTSYWVNGKMDQLLFYDSALTQSDVTALYNSGSGTSTPSTTNLIAHYDFEQSSSTLENQVYEDGTGTLLSFENTSGETISYEIETDKARVAKDTLTTVNNYDVTWDSSSVANQSVNGNTITGTTATWTGWTVSNEKISDGQSVEFDISTCAHFTLGLDATGSNDNPSGTYQNADYSFHTTTANNNIYENGSQIGSGQAVCSSSSTPYTAKIEIDGSDIKYYKDGTLVQTSSGASGEYYITVGIANNGGTASAVLSSYSTLTKTNIIEATGQSISTSVPSHLMFTRDASNGWEIFLDGTSIQTATDSTSLGTAKSLNPLVHYDFEQYGSTATNQGTGGSSYDGTISGATYTTGKLGQALDFDGSNDVVNGFTQGLGDQFSVAFWVNFDSVNNWASIMGKGASDASEEFISYTHSNGAISGEAIPGTNLNSGQVPSTGQWYHVVYSIDGTNGEYKTYVDGVLKNTSTGTASNSYETGANFKIGSSRIGDFFDGKIDQVLVFDSIINQDDVNTIFNSSSGQSSFDPTYYIGQSPSGTNTLPSLDEFAIWTSDKGSEASDIYDRGANTFAQIGTTTGSTVTFSDNNSLVSGSEYFHRIIANNGAFDSDPSNVSSATAGVPPDAPTNLQASINNPNTAPLDVTLTWTDGAGQGTGVFQNYIVIRSPDASFTTVTTVGTPTATTFTDTVPSGGGTFYYKVSDQSSHGGSPNSAAASATTPTVPDAPTISLAINNPDPSPLTITTTFTAPANDGGSAITGYHLFHSTDDVTYTQVATNTASPHDHTVSGVGTHYFKAQAVNLVGASVDSTAQSIATPTAPGAPASLTITLPDVDTAPFTVTLDWTAPASDGGSAVTGYKVYRDSTLLATLGNTVLTYSDTTPSNASTVFNFEVTAINNAAEGTAVSQSWTSPAVPSQVQGLGGNVFNQAVILTWQMPQSDSAITDFEVFRSGSSYAFVGSNSTTYTDSANIIPDSSITYAVKGISLVGTGAASSDALVSTGSGAVLDLTSTNIIENSLVLTWTEPTYAAGSVLGYMINYTTPYGTPDTILVSDTQTTVTVQPLSNLAYSANYTFTVGTITPLGVNASGNWHTVQTNEDLSITSFNVTQGFDIEAVNTQEIDQIKFDRVENSDGTTTLDVIHPTYYNIYCNLDSKFAMTNQNYTNLSTTVISGQDQKASFVFTDLDNDVITIKCTDTVTNDNAIYILTQNNFPILDQIANFKAGEYGTAGLFGVLDLVTLFIVIISMIGFNRINESVGAIFNFILLGGTAYFGIIELPTAIFGAMAVVLMLVITTTRKK